MSKRPHGALKKRLASLKRWVAKYAPPALAVYRRAQFTAAALSARRRRSSVATYIGVTGSCGKSTTTYLTGELLAATGSTVTARHLNTAVNVMRALGALRGKTDFFVQEISGHQPGHIASLTPVLIPDVAVITAVGDDHRTAFKSKNAGDEAGLSVGDRTRRAIATEKGTLVSGLSEQGIACLNADDDLVRAMSGRARGRVVLFGTSPDAEVRADQVDCRWPGRLSFDLVIGSQRRRVRTGFVGSIMLTNSLGALAVVHALGRDVDAAVAQLERLPPYGGRMEVMAGAAGHTFVCDTVKAPLWSVQRLIDDLHLLACPSLIFVLGEVSDTRNDKSATYRRLLRALAVEAKFVIGFGPVASSATKVREAGYSNVLSASSQNELDRLLVELSPGLVILKSNESTPLLPTLGERHAAPLDSA